MMHAGRQFRKKSAQRTIYLRPMASTTRSTGSTLDLDGTRTPRINSNIVLVSNTKRHLPEEDQNRAMHAKYCRHVR